VFKGQANSRLPAWVWEPMLGFWFDSDGLSDVSLSEDGCYEECEGGGWIGLKHFIVLSRFFNCIAPSKAR